MRLVRGLTFDLFGLEVPELAELVVLLGAGITVGAVAASGVGIQLVEMMVGHGERGLAVSI